MTTHAKPLGRRRDIVIQELREEILIYNLQTDRAYCLNKTASLIWQLCDGNKTAGEISIQISRQLKSPVNEEFVWVALERLYRENLIENDFGFSIPCDALSRREIIRKAGAATLAALPVVASLVAPAAAAAQSSRCFGNNNARQSALGCTCDSANDCRSNCCGTNGTASTCVTAGLDATGAACRAGCECSSNCCVGNVCQDGDLAPGQPCATACQCASNSCPPGTPRVCA